MKALLRIFICLLLPLSLAHCTTLNKAQQYELLQEKIKHLDRELAREKQLKQDGLSKADGEKLTLLETKNAEISRILAEKEKLENVRDSLTTKNAELNTLILAKETEIAKLKTEIETLTARNYAMNTKILTLEAQKTDQSVIVEEKETEISALKQAQNDLEKSLKSELDSYKAKLEMTERGLVITFLAEIFFDSGKNVIKEEAHPTLAKVATVLNTKVGDSRVAIEGNTDNDPIRYSLWESNWELSSARALAVLHYFIDTGLVDPARLSAVGNGEFNPVASNDTPQGKQQNRRVEIVILPAQIAKVKPTV
jgi:chemotaxis protein MotB